MKIRIHFPTTEEGRLLLQDRITETHARIIKDYIEKLQCSRDHKIRLYNEIKEDIRIKLKNEKKVAENNLSDKMFP